MPEIVVLDGTDVPNPEDIAMVQASLHVSSRGGWRFCR